MYELWSVIGGLPMALPALFVVFRIVTLFTVYGNLEIQEMWGALCCVLAGPEYRRKLRVIMEHRDRPLLEETHNPLLEELHNPFDNPRLEPKVKAELCPKCGNAKDTTDPELRQFYISEGISPCWCSYEPRQFRPTSEIELCYSCGAMASKWDGLCMPCFNEDRRRRIKRREPVVVESIGMPPRIVTHSSSPAELHAAAEYLETVQALNGDWTPEQERELHELLDKRRRPG